MTGVQTCALPISGVLVDAVLHAHGASSFGEASGDHGLQLPLALELALAFGDDDLESLKKLSILENYREIQLKVADFVLEQMAKVEIFGPTVYHLPVAPIDYSNYFDKVIILRQTEDFDHEHLKNHAEEEGFPPEVELELLKTQKIYFYELFERGIWKIKNK